VPRQYVADNLGERQEPRGDAQQQRDQKPQVFAGVLPEAADGFDQIVVEPEDEGDRPAAHAGDDLRNAERQAVKKIADKFHHVGNPNTATPLISSFMPMAMCFPSGEMETRHG
jgi:hypothetical protein